MLIQQIAEELDNVSHRVRLACQDLEIEIDMNDQIPDDVWADRRADITTHVGKQMEERSNA